MDHPATTADYYRDTEDEAKTLALSRACVAHVKSIDPSFALISPILTPRFAPSCSTESMRALAKFSHEANIPIQTHISENVLECELVKKLFPDHQSYTHVYDSVGLLTNRTILAHAIHLDDSERALIRDRGTKISHCPASNTALTSGTAKVRTLLDEGLTVGLGTDVSGGYTPSVLAEAREAIFVSRHVAMIEGEKAKLSVAEALYLATRGGAKVCGLESKIGGFEVGMSWDAQLVGLKKVPDEVADGNDEVDDDAGLVDVFGKENWDDKIAKWLYTGDDRNTLAVWVQGRLVHSRKSFQP
jgi:guanine deaminase